VIDTLIFVFGAFYGNLWDFGGYTMYEVSRILIGQFLVKAIVALVFSYYAFMKLTKKFREQAELAPLVG
jgi:uncharacterized PurR-regulated membrane protein YhhQ (DUF165 family)